MGDRFKTESVIGMGQNMHFNIDFMQPYMKYLGEMGGGKEEVINA
jgi:hypothetical protein